MTPSIAKTAPLRHRSNRLFYLAMIPMIFLSMTACWLIMSEISAQSRLNAEVEHLRQSGDPVDDASMAAWFHSHTRPEGQLAWTEAITCSHALGELQADLPIVGMGALPDELCPGAQWSDAPQVQQFLEYAAPLLNHIHQAAQYPTPVRLNPLFEGTNTRLFPLQESRNMVRMLQLDCIYAGYTQDADRALKDLDSMSKIADAFDWDLFLVGQLVHIALRGIHQGEINRSLSCNLWQPEQLQQLLNQVSQPMDVAKKWRTGISGERAMMMAALFDTDPHSLSYMSEGAPNIMLMLHPSGKLRLLHAYRKLQDLSITPWMESYTNPNQTQINLDDSSSNYFATDASPFWMQMFLPAERALVAAYQRVEQNRRLTRTALGIKLYERQHGTWPRDLQDLEQVGLSIQDWTVPGIGSFGYRIQPEGAQVWGMNPQAPEASQQITATPPTSQEGTDRSEIWWLVDIR